MANLEMAKKSICRCENYLQFDMKTFLPSELPPPMFILLLLSFGGKISNGKNNSQLLMDNFVISRFAIIEEIASHRLELLE